MLTEQVASGILFVACSIFAIKNEKMRSKHILFIVASLYILQGCNMEKCNDDIDYGTYELSDAALEFNPYSDQYKTVVFIDSLSNEYRFIIQDNVLHSSSNNSVPGPCPEDSTRIVNYKSKSNYYRVKLTGIEISTEFQIWLNPVPQPNQNGESGDELIILNPGDTYNCLYHRINQKDNNGNPISHEDNSFVLDSLKVFDKTFYQVVINNPEGFNKNPRYRVGYNRAFGLVWLEDTQLSKRYAFERIDN